MTYRNVRTWIVSSLAVALGLFCVLADPSPDRSAEITVNSKVGTPSLERVELRPAAVDRIAEATNAGSLPLNSPDRGWVDALRYLSAYEITPPADHPAGDEQYQAQNRAQGLRVGFSPQGIHVVPRGSVEGLRMELSGIGYGDQLEQVSDGLLEPSGERIDYHRTTAAGAELTEWYINSPKGVEQGFTLPAPPAANQTGQPLVLELELSGGFEPTLEAGGGAIAFAMPDGNGTLRYSGLHAYDAGGDELASWMEVREGSVALVVDDSKARYPVTVDPLITTTETKLTAGDPAGGDQFGHSVAISGDTAVVGAAGNDDAGSLSGSAYVFVRTGTTWTEEAKLTASDAAAGDIFGISVAVSGDTAVVGAAKDQDGGFGSGSAYVFVRSGTKWTEKAKLTASDPAPGDFFGFHVAVSFGTAVVGAHFDDDAGSLSGSAYVFEKPETGWADATENAKLTASDAAAGDIFGRSVAICCDTVVVGAAGNDDAGSDSGLAYVFQKPDTGWAGNLNEDAKLTASDATSGDRFGLSVAISGGGETAVVGAQFAGSSASGAAYVFVFDGTSWSQEAKLIASDAATFDRFGLTVALSGETAVVGAQFNDDAGFQSGSAYRFVRTGTTWTEEAKLTANDAAANDWFGSSVAVSGDTVVIGAWRNDDAGSDSGSAYVFATTTLTPEEAAEILLTEIEDLVDAGELNQGQGKALGFTLKHAAAHLALGHDQTACALFGSFVFLVNGLIKAGQVSEAVGQPLIDVVNEIRDEFGC